MRSVREIILARRSIRRYLPTPLSRETVEELLEAGRYAPSGHNKQAWRFTAILDQKLLQELNQLVRAGFAALALGEDAPKELRDPTFQDRLFEVTKLQSLAYTGEEIKAIFEQVYDEAAEIYGPID